MESAGERQMNFAFAESPEGDKAGRPVDESAGRAHLLHKAKGRKTTPPAAEEGKTEKLMEEIASEANLARALLAVARNRGAPGVDGKRVGEVVEESAKLLPRLREVLLAGEYRPEDIKRVWIPKPGGGARGLGIPVVMDRWVQQAVHQVLSPLWEPVFHSSSHGFRPGRGAQTAMAEAKGYVEAGYAVVVELDLSKFFDRVNHQRLLGRVEQRVKDRRVLDLIWRMLKARVVLPDGTRAATEEGTPQGGPLSPLLSNIVLDELDQELARRSLRFVRYADDFNIFVRSERSGERVMQSVKRFLQRRLRLQVNEEKSSVTTPEKLHFLGFRFERREGGEVDIHISKRSEERIKERIVEATPRNWGQSLLRCMEKLNVYLTGWVAYFGLCTRAGAERMFNTLDAHIRRRLRAIIIKQKKRPRYLFRHLCECGVGEKAAGFSAYSSRGVWHRSHTRGIESAYPNAWFGERLVSLWGSWCRLNSPPSAQCQLSFDF